jgi:hypothetical protein
VAPRSGESKFTSTTLEASAPVVGGSGRLAGCIALREVLFILDGAIDGLNAACLCYLFLGLLGGEASPSSCASGVTSRARPSCRWRRRDTTARLLRPSSGRCGTSRQGGSPRRVLKRRWRPRRWDLALGGASGAVRRTVLERHLTIHLGAKSLEATSRGRIAKWICVFRSDGVEFSKKPQSVCCFRKRGISILTMPESPTSS